MLPFWVPHNAVAGEGLEPWRFRRGRQKKERRGFCQVLAGRLLRERELAGGFCQILVGRLLRERVGWNPERGERQLSQTRLEIEGLDFFS